MASSQPSDLQQPATASNVENGQPAAPEEEIWDEERLEKAMKTLKEMHIQVLVPETLKISLVLTIL